MNKKEREEYNKEIDNKVKQLKKMKKVAEQVTLTEFIEQYPLHQHIILGSMWYAVNPDEISYDEAIKYVGGTD
tara:strand:- start:61 stop:279 length:219 start_codon:yes stop_codon:yes gene_type:complete